MLSFEDLKDMEGDGQEVACHFCNNREQISKEEVSKLITEAQAKPN